MNEKREVRSPLFENYLGGLFPRNSANNLQERYQVFPAARVATANTITPRPTAGPVQQWAKLVRVTSARINVQRGQVPYWGERGWQKWGNQYIGKYQVRELKLNGRATTCPSGDVEMFIENSVSLKNIMVADEKWSCFVLRPNGWLAVHTNNCISDVSAGLLEVEAILAEVYSAKQKQARVESSYNNEQNQILLFFNYFLERILR
jgi:hypothetical protein